MNQQKVDYAGRLIYPIRRYVRTRIYGVITKKHELEVRDSQTLY